MAIASLILGIICIGPFCLWMIDTPVALLAIVFGCLGLKRPNGRGMAIAGIVCGSLGLCLSILAMVLSAIYTAKAMK